MDFVSKDTVYYRVNTTKSFKDNTIGAVIVVAQDVKTYDSRVVVSRTTTGAKGNKRILYKGIVDVCNFAKFEKSVKIFSPLLTILNDPRHGNFSMRCPLKKGVYVMKNIHIPDNSAVLRFLYAPNCLYTMSTLVSWTFPNGSKVLMHDFNVTLTIIKKC